MNWLFITLASLAALIQLLIYILIIKRSMEVRGFTRAVLNFAILLGVLNVVLFGFSFYLLIIKGV
jgi:hypothetical protein